MVAAEAVLARVRARTKANLRLWGTVFFLDLSIMEF
jgi:hypothetical protein